MGKNELSNKDIAELKRNLRSELKNYNKFPSDIPLSIDEMEDITQSKDITNNKKVIRKLVFDKLDNECPIDKDNIIYCTTFLAGQEMAASYASINWTPGGTCYYRVYLSKSDVMIYSLDNYYRVIASRKVPLSDIDFAGISMKDTEGLKLSKENLIINIIGNDKTESLLYYFLPERNDKEEMKKFYDLLIENGVRSFVPKRLSPAVYFAYFISFLTALYCIYTLISK